MFSNFVYVYRLCMQSYLKVLNSNICSAKTVCVDLSIIHSFILIYYLSSHPSARSQYHSLFTHSSNHFLTHSLSLTHSFTHSITQKDRLVNERINEHASICTHDHTNKSISKQTFVCFIKNQQIIVYMYMYKK